MDRNVEPCDTCNNWQYKRTLVVHGCEDAEMHLRTGYCEMWDIIETTSIVPFCDKHMLRLNIKNKYGNG